MLIHIDVSFNSWMIFWYFSDSDSIEFLIVHIFDDKLGIFDSYDDTYMSVVGIVSMSFELYDSTNSWSFTSRYSLCFCITYPLICISSPCHALILCDIGSTVSAGKTRIVAMILYSIHSRCSGEYTLRIEETFRFIWYLWTLCFTCLIDSWDQIWRIKISYKWGLHLNNLEGKYMRKAHHNTNECARNRCYRSRVTIHRMLFELKSCDPPITSPLHIPSMLYKFHICKYSNILLENSMCNTKKYELWKNLSYLLWKQSSLRGMPR